ncbi:MAG: hypothetical protein Q4F83_05010 [Eubacteriales bacterium]|nr:hypothetical protein [Eubacteriales bacterium]
MGHGEGYINCCDENIPVKELKSLLESEKFKRIKDNEQFLVSLTDMLKHTHMEAEKQKVIYDAYNFSGNYYMLCGIFRPEYLGTSVFRRVRVGIV